MGWPHDRGGEEASQKSHIENQEDDGRKTLQ
jgi:hypothetical protein